MLPWTGKYGNLIASRPAEISTPRCCVVFAESALQSRLAKGLSVSLGKRLDLHGHPKRLVAAVATVGNQGQADAGHEHRDVIGPANVSQFMGKNGAKLNLAPTSPIGGN